MASNRQVSANKKNAQKCTGPTTPEGKATSSQNAFKTGLDAQSEVIKTENREHYETLTAEFYNRFQPVAPEERSLVDALIKAEWLGRRYTTAEAAIWEFDFDNVDTNDIGRVFIRRSEILTRVDRRMSSAQRNFISALKQLKILQAARPADPAQPEAATPEPPTIIAPQELKPKLVSFFTPAPATAPTPISNPITEEEPPLAA